MLPSPEMYVDWREWASALLSNLLSAPEPLRLQPFTTAKLPSALRSKYMLVYCTDLVTPQPVYSDGVDWRRVTDGSIV